MAKIVFRPATAQDTDALVTLRARFLAEVSGSDPSAPELLLALRRYFQAAIPAGNFIGFVALVGGEVVATGGLVFHTHPPTAKNLAGREAYILDMYTLPAWRKRGIASRLLEKLVEHAHAAGHPRVSLHSTPQARPIYQALGFEETDDEMRLDLRKLGRRQKPRAKPGVEE
jgi:GNAT superfamily N-acetyltransferase